MPITTLNIFAGTIYTLIFLISVSNVINPKWMWEKFESHNAKKEPTKEYFMTRRIVGCIGLMLIALLISFPLMGYIHS